MFVRANHLRLHVQVEGLAQGMPLVFINSLGCDLSIWDEVVLPFQKKYLVIRYDERGQGRSGTPPGPYTLREHTEDLADLLAVLEVREAVVIGISIGGLIAMDFALQHPEMVRGLVLCDTAPKIGTTETWNERMRAVTERGLDGIAEAIVGRWLTPGFAHSHLAAFRDAQDMLCRTPQEGYIANCAALRDADLGGSIQAIAAPVLAVCGAEDGVVTPEQTRMWAGKLPRLRVAIIPGAAHLPCLEQPAALAGVIADFLREECHA